VPAACHTACGGHASIAARTLRRVAITRARAASVSAVAAVADVPVPSPQQPLPAPWPSLAVGGKVINVYSIIFLVINMLSLCVAYPLLVFATTWSLLFDRKRRRAIDMVVALWARLCITFFFFSRVRVEGLEHLPPRGQAALYTPNHCSFLDIFALSGFLPRPLKYVSKIEILRIPLIGWAMQLAGHIALRRSDRKSQLATFRDSVDCLKNGNGLVRARRRAPRRRAHNGAQRSALRTAARATLHHALHAQVTFAEGTRSPTGVLGAFKAGPFKMAASAGVPVVPISIVNTQYSMPVSALLPIRRAQGVRIIVHPPISTIGRDAADVCAEAREAVSNGLPEWMRS
jgi:1-acyl-sn-glycerol-3-phosphate acyltransferase